MPSRRDQEPLLEQPAGHRQQLIGEHPFEDAVMELLEKNQLNRRTRPSSRASIPTA